MIDAINSYSSTHGGRAKNTIAEANPHFGRVFQGHGDTCVLEKKPQKQSELGAFLFVSGCAGAISLITDTLLNASELMKSDFTPVKSIAKNAGIWAVIGGACFGFFKAIERVALRKDKA